MAFRAVLFDLDGTLLDTLEDIADSMNAALEARGFPPHDIARYKVFVGDGIATLAERVLPEARRTPDEIAATLARMGDEYQQRWNAKSKPYPGVPALLDALEERGLPMAVVSNKPHRFTVSCVEVLLETWEFAQIIGVDESTPRKPDPAGALRAARNLGVTPGETLYVGDTNTDMRTAVAAGMFPVGVAWGFRPVEELREHGAREILDRPADLLRLL